MFATGIDSGVKKYFYEIISEIATAPIFLFLFDERIEMEWINFAWQAAVDQSQISDTPSNLVLEFRDNTVGAEIVMTHTGVPSYEVSLNPSPFNPKGELSSFIILRLHINIPSQSQ